MNKTKLITSLGGAFAASLLTAPLAQASKNPFALQEVTTATHLAEMEKGADGKCGEGKCGERGVAIFAKACFGHPSPSKRQKLNATAMPSAPRFVLVTTSRPNRGSEHWLQMT